MGEPHSGEAVGVVLASASPRRRELLAGLGVAVRVVPADIDESVAPDEAPHAYVARLAAAKAAAVVDRVAPPAAGGSLLVVAADTTVDVDGVILGKPSDADQARAMLALLAGRSHQVHTGVALVCLVGDGQGRVEQRTDTAVVSTTVRFGAVDDAAASWYVATGEPFDKAGGYALQGAGGVFVTEVLGSVSNVIGLPLAEVVAMADRLGHPLLGGPVQSVDGR